MFIFLTRFWGGWKFIKDDLVTFNDNLLALSHGSNPSNYVEVKVESIL